MNEGQSILLMIALIIIGTFILNACMIQVM